MKGKQENILSKKGVEAFEKHGVKCIDMVKTDADDKVYYYAACINDKPSTEEVTQVATLIKKGPHCGDVALRQGHRNIQIRPPSNDCPFKTQ